MCETRNLENRIKLFLNTRTANGMLQKQINAAYLTAAAAAARRIRLTVANATATAVKHHQHREKKPEIYEQREVVNKFEQRPEEIKFESSVAVEKKT